MSKHVKLIRGFFIVVLCLMVVLSILDSHETRYETNFDQDRILTHIENLTANGPRSIVHTAANRQALAYIAETLEGYGLVNADTTDVPAYQIQSYVAEDTRYQNWYLENIIVHIPANGANPTGQAQMFMGHFDSVPMGPGASDDGVAVSVMLEAIRYYLDRMDQGFTMNNDLVFCFVNGEEYGLYGSAAFVNEFQGFGNVVDRIRFGTNLESRGTSGTLIMFETAANNLNTVKLFSGINDNVFTCSIATMIYDMMPNGTDFSNFKHVYQGLNLANISGGENYHTQNDNFENVGLTYLSQQAMVVDRLIETLADYDLDRLHEAEESAIFFTYLNAGTLVYTDTVSMVLALILLLMMAAHTLLNRDKHAILRTARAAGIIVISLLLTAGVTYICYYLFQYIAVLAGTIDIHMVGTITYSNTAIVIGIGLIALAMTTLTAYLAQRWLKVTFRDLNRAFAYLHGLLGAALTVLLPDASYLFVFSGLMLMGIQLLITFKRSAMDWGTELLAIALYMPIIMPILVLATSALGLTMAWVFGLIFALGIFPVGVFLAPLCEKCSLRRLFGRKTGTVEGCLHILAAAMVIFLCVSLCKPNASVNLQGKQNLSRLPYDDALVYVLDADGSSEYRVYDLNALPYLEDHAPAMTWTGEYYAAAGEVEVDHAIRSAANGSVLTVEKTDDASLVYLTFTDIRAESFTIDDGRTSNTYTFDGLESYAMTIHSDCTVTVNGGSAAVSYQEVLRDYDSMVPAGLHFNLWLTDTYTLAG